MIDSEQKIVRYHRRQLMVILSIVFSLLLLVFLNTAFIFFVFFYDTWAGKTRFGAKIQFQQAMDRGDGKAAVYYGQKLVKFYTNREGKLTDPSVKFQLAMGYELNEDYEKAIETYGLDENYRRFMGVARVYYKQGRYEEAFFEYCYCVLRHEYKEISFEIIERAVLCKHLGKVRDRMCPFDSYEQFTKFIEEEYAHLGTPSEYDEAMQLFRAVKNEIVEENLPRSGASNNRDAQRKKILAEQKQQP